MSRHPTQGVQNSKPRVPKADGKATKAEISKLSAEYLRTRNRTQAAKAEASEMELAQKRGALLSKRLACLQVGYMLTCFRQRVLAEPATLASRLVTGGFLEETRQHDAQEMIKNDLCAMLEELSDLPFRISDPDWIQKIDADLRVQGDEESERVTDPFRNQAPG